MIEKHFKSLFFHAFSKFKEQPRAQKWITAY
jgi:hypothetical protein